MEASRLTCSNYKSKHSQKINQKGNKVITEILTRCSNTDPQSNNNYIEELRVEHLVKMLVKILNLLPFLVDFLEMFILEVFILSHIYYLLGTLI